MDSAGRARVWPPDPKAAAAAAGDGRAKTAGGVQLRVSTEAGAPPRVLREFAARLGVDLSSVSHTATGGRELTVRSPCDAAALLDGATVTAGGSPLHLMVVHPRGPRLLIAGLTAARERLGGIATEQRAQALRQLADGKPLYVPELDAVAQRMREVQREAHDAGCARAAAAGQQGVAAVEAVGEDPLAALLGDSASAAPMEDLRAELALRQASVEREQPPAGEDGDEAMRNAGKERAVQLLQKLDTAAADGAQIFKQQQQVASVMVQEAGLATYFRAKLPPIPRASGNGGGRRPDAAAPGGGPANGAAQPQRVVAPAAGGGGKGAQTPPSAAAAAAAAAAGRKGGKGKGSPGGKGKGGYDDYDDRANARAPPRDPTGGRVQDRSGPDYRVPCCADGCAFRAKTPQALVTHYAAKHGDAPYNGQEQGAEEWQRKVKRSMDVVARATGVRPGEHGWHHGDHVGRGRGGGGRR